MRLNGVDLDYVPVTQLAVEIDEIESIEGVAVEVAWLDENYTVGDWALVDVDVSGMSMGLDPVQTGVTLAGGSIIVSLLVVLLWVWASFNKKYLSR